jgi:hypothetical protein
MKKIAIFTEGQGELIFIRHYLLQTIDNAKLSIECYMLYANDLKAVPFTYKCPNPEIHFFLVNVGGDNKVLSAIKERKNNLLKNGYEKIIGIRDMYCELYQNLSPQVINIDVTKLIINETNEEIQSIDNENRINIYFCIMEFESWFLSMYNLFCKLDYRLTVDYITCRLGFNLKEIDPQTIFYKPSNELNLIYSFIGNNYTKRDDDIESLCSNMNIEDFENAIENGRCQSFDLFYQSSKTFM